MNNPVWTAEAGRRVYASAAWKWLTPASMTLAAALALADVTSNPSPDSRVAAAEGSTTRGILEALPQPDHLGTDWKREVTFLFDPRSEPAKITPTGVRLPDALVMAQRAAVRDPAGKVSAWANVQYDLRSAGATNRYEVQIYQYRSKEVLIEDFDQLLALRSERYEKTMIRDLAAVAVAFRDARTRSGTLWFRTGRYQVWISPSTWLSWGSDTSLRHLAGALIRQLGIATHQDAEANRISHSLQTSEHAWTAILRETESEKLRLTFLRWDEPASHDREIAVFRLTNPGPRSVLVWNERVQVRSEKPGADEAPEAWETVHRDYPTFGLPGPLKGGESFEFKWRVPERSPWRLCLIYSRDTATSVLPAGTTRFEDNYEVIGPVLESQPFPIKEPGRQP